MEVVIEELILVLVRFSRLGFLPLPRFLQPASCFSGRVFIGCRVRGGVCGTVALSLSTALAEG